MATPWELQRRRQERRDENMAKVTADYVNRGRGAKPVSNPAPVVKPPVVEEPKIEEVKPEEPVVEEEQLTEQDKMTGKKPTARKKKNESTAD